MSRTQRNILILGAGMVIIILMIVLLLLPLDKKPATPSSKLPEAVAPSAPTAPLAELSSEEKKAVAAKANLELETRRLAQLFIERYGSFSNQGNYENISDLYPLMTANMRRVSAFYAEEQKRAHPLEAAYYGVTTKARSSQIVSVKENRVTIKVNTQREEASGVSTTSKVMYQSATLSLARLGDKWKVDDVDWEEVK